MARVADIEKEAPGMPVKPCGWSSSWWVERVHKRISVWEAPICWLVKCPEFHVYWLQKGSVGNRHRLVWLFSPYCSSHLLLLEKFWLRREAKENSAGVTLQRQLASQPYGTAGSCLPGTIISDLHQSIPFKWDTCPRGMWIHRARFHRVSGLTGYWGMG